MYLSDYTILIRELQKITNTDTTDLEELLALLITLGETPSKSLKMTKEDILIKDIYVDTTNDNWFKDRRVLR